MLGDAVPDLVEDAQLVVTELVTNAQLHGAPPIAVRSFADGGTARVEVQDASRKMLVLPAHSLDAMTGRGLRMVAAVSVAWGVDPAPDGNGKVVWAELAPGETDEAQVAPDIDALLDLWGDDDLDDEPHHEVRLGSVPTALLLEAKRHIDNVVRELTLERAAGGDTQTAELAVLIETVTKDFALARSEIKRQAAAAAARGDAETALVLRLPVSSVAAGERYLAALDEADRYARDARLLTLETPPLHQVFRRWYVSALVDQLRAAAEHRTPEPPRPFAQVLSDEVTALSELQDVAHRLAVLQRVNALLARARTPAEMARIVTRLAVEQLRALSGRVYLVDGDALVSLSDDGGTTAWSARYDRIPVQADLPGPVVFRTGVPMVLRSLQQIAARFPELSHVYDRDRSLHVVPLVAGAHRLGVLAVSFAVGGRLSEAAHTEFVQALADALAQALDRTGVAVDADEDVAAAVDYVALFRGLPTSYLVMDRDLVFVEANDAYLATVGRTRDELLGRPVFEMFPPTPDALEPGTNVSRVQLSLERARDTGRPDTMPVQKYDIPDPDGDGMVERYWSLISVPILDAYGRVAFVAQRAEDITDFVRERERGARAVQDSAEWQRRVQEVEADLFARGKELEETRAAKDEAAERLTRLATVALDLTSAETVEDLAGTVFRRGLSVLGADGGAISVRDDAAGVVRLSVSDELGERVQVAYAELPLTSPLPAAYVAVHGRTVLFPNRAAGLAWSPETAEVYALTDRDAWATLPLRVGDELIGALVASWREEREFTDDDLELLEGFAAQVAQALQRIRVTQAQRHAALAAQRMSETLQRSLLTDPAQPEGVAIAVRYQPAAAEAHVGGDWYDSFRTAEGSTLLAIGDVTGHDRRAAAAMGQVRNLLRGLAYDSSDGPATLLTRLDRAMLGLRLDALATAVVARVETVDGSPDRVLRWSNAGHPPLVVRGPDGVVTVLEADDDLMLGIDPETPRRERSARLAPGTTLVMFTDGLIERRDRDLDEGLDRLVARLASLPDIDPGGVADALLTLVDASSSHDDIALLVLHVEA